jgi:hypothetical protein
MNKQLCLLALFVAFLTLCLATAAPIYAALAGQSASQNEAQINAPTAGTVTGEYRGQIELKGAYTGVHSDTTATPTPMSLGNIDLVFNLTQNGNAVNGYISLNKQNSETAAILDSSLVFTVEHVIDGQPVGPLVSGNFDGATLKLESEKVTVTAIGKRFTRQFSLATTAVEDGGDTLIGIYRETVWGGSPQPATVVGAFHLRRAGFAAAPGSTNNLPFAVADSATTRPGMPITVHVLANDTDPDGDPLTVTSVSSPQHGTATTDGQSVTYTPEPGFVGVDSFSYFVADGKGGEVAGTVTVTVTGDDGVVRDQVVYLPLIQR